MQLETQTVSALVSVFLALTLYPDVKKLAQAELDSVVGRDRLPTFDDRPRLPYIDAFCKEVLRWHMVLPLGTYVQNAHFLLTRIALRTIYFTKPFFVSRFPSRYN
jgi:cytochrome P450